MSYFYNFWKTAESGPETPSGLEDHDFDTNYANYVKNGTESTTESVESTAELTTNSTKLQTIRLVCDVLSSVAIVTGVVLVVCEIKQMNRNLENLTRHTDVVQRSLSNVIGKAFGGYHIRTAESN